jgi:hypothetical protein
MDRETTEVRIGDHKFQVKTYANALEGHLISQVLLKGAKMEVIGETPKITDFDIGAQFEMQKEMIAQMVVSMDDNKERIVERCLELRRSEFDQLIAELDEIISKKN